MTTLLEESPTLHVVTDRLFSMWAVQFNSETTRLSWRNRNASRTGYKVSKRYVNDCSNRWVFRHFLKSAKDDAAVEISPIPPGGLAYSLSEFFFSKITCTVVHLRSVWVSYLDVESCRGQNACNYQGWVSCYPGVFNAMVWACTSPLMGEHMMLKISFVIAKTSVHFLSCTNYWKMPFSCRICCNSYLQMSMTTNRCAVMEYWGRMFY